MEVDEACRNKYFLFIYKIDVVHIFILWPNFLKCEDIWKLSLTKLKSLKLNTRGFKTCLKLSLPVSSEPCKQTLGILSHKILFKCRLLERLPQWNKHVYTIYFHTTPIIRSWNKWRFRKKKKHVPPPGKPSRFAGSYRETVGSFSCFSFFSCGNNTEKQLQNWRWKKTRRSLQQASKAKEKGNERLEGNAKAAATRPWKSQKFQELKSTMKSLVTFNIHGK